MITHTATGSTPLCESYSLQTARWPVNTQLSCPQLRCAQLCHLHSVCARLRADREMHPNLPAIVTCLVACNEACYLMLELQDSMEHHFYLEELRLQRQEEAILLLMAAQRQRYMLLLALAREEACRTESDR